MAISLYELSVPTFLQTLSAVRGFLDRTIAYCEKVGVDPDENVTARLFPDMAPLHFQIEALTHHSVWGIEAVKTGAFSPPPLVGRVPFADLRSMVDQAVRALDATDPDDINSRSGMDLDISLYRPVDEENPTTSKWAPQVLAFTSETFLLSFSMPNFHFHAVTAYGILRSRGVPIGKRHYEGELRTRLR